jgi:hypothetical protein
VTAHGGTAAGAALFGGNAYFAYIRGDSTIGIIIEHNTGYGAQSPTSYALPETAQFGTTLIAFNGTLYLFYVDWQTHLSMMRSQDGVNWDGPWQLNSYTQWNTPPAAVVWDNTVIVYISYACESYEQCMYQGNISGTSASWYPYFNNGVPPATFGRATAVAWNGTLYLAWADMLYGGQQIFIQHYTDAAGWESDWTETGKNGIPSLYPVANGQLEMIYRGTDSHIYHTYTTDGVSFGPSYKDNASTTNRSVTPFENWGSSYNWTLYVGIDNELFTVVE